MYRSQHQVLAGHGQSFRVVCVPLLSHGGLQQQYGQQALAYLQKRSRHMPRYTYVACSESSTPWGGGVDGVSAALSLATMELVMSSTTKQLLPTTVEPALSRMCPRQGGGAQSALPDDMLSTRQCFSMKIGDHTRYIGDHTHCMLWLPSPYCYTLTVWFLQYGVNMSTGAIHKNPDAARCWLLGILLCSSCMAVDRYVQPQELASIAVIVRALHIQAPHYCQETEL